MAIRPNDFDEESIYELILANQEATAALHQDSERLRLLLQLRVVKGSTSQQLIADYVRWSREVLRPVEAKRSDLQFALSAMVEAQRIKSRRMRK